MKILFLTHRVPYPPNKGDKIRAFNILRYLSKRHSIWLASLCDDRDDLKYVANLRKYCRSIDIVPINMRWTKAKSMFYLFSTRPLTLPCFYSARLKSLVEKNVKEEKIKRIYIY